MRKSIRKIVSAVLAASMAFTGCFVGNTVSTMAAFSGGGVCPVASLPATVSENDSANTNIIMGTADDKQAYSGEVTATVKFNLDSVSGTGTLLVLNTLKDDGNIGDAGQLGLRITDKTGAVAFSKGDTTPACGSLVAGDNTVVFTLNTNTHEASVQLNGGDVVTATDSDSVTNILGVKFNKKTGRTAIVTSLEVTGTPYGAVAEDTTTTTEVTTTTTTEVTTTTTTEAATEATTAAPVVNPSNSYVFVPSADVEDGATAFSNDDVEIVAAQKNSLATSADVVTIGNNSYSSYTQTNSVNTKLAVGGETKTYRLAYKITAKKDVAVKVDHKVAANKANYILKNVDATAGTAELVDSSTNSGTSSAYETFSFDLKAGESVWVAGQGSNIVVYAIDAKSADSEVTTEATTTTTTEVTTTTTTEATTTTEDTTVTEAPTEIQTSIAADEIGVSVAKATVKVGETVEVPVSITGNSADKGFNNYTMFINFDPEVVSLEDVADGDIALTVGGVAYKASNAADIKAQLTNVPEAGNTDFAGADGVKTQAELGRVKVAFVIDQAAVVDGTTSLDSFKDNGTLFTLTVKGVKEGVANLTVEVVNDEFQVVSSDATIAKTLAVKSTAEDVTVEAGTVEPEGYVYIPSSAAKAGDVVYGDFNAEIKAAQDLNLNTTDVPGEVKHDDNTVGVYPNNLQTTGTNTTLTVDGTDGTYRVAFEVTAVKDCTVVVDSKASSGKTNYLIKTEDGTTGTVVASLDNSTGSSSIYGVMSVELKAGEKILVAGKGTNPVIYAIDIIGAEDNNEVSTEGTTTTTTEKAPETTTVVTGFSFGNGKTEAKAGSEASLDLALYNNPGFNSFSFFIEYDPTYITLKSASSSDSAVAEMVNSQIAYTPSSSNPDYSTDGTKTTAQLGKVKVAYVKGASEVKETSNGTYLTLTFDVAANAPAGEYVVKTVGTEGNYGFYTVAAPLDVTMLDNVIVIKDNSVVVDPTTTTTEEPTTEVTTTTTTDGTTTTTIAADTTTETSTKGSNSSSGGGGTKKTTTTEATTEATTAKVEASTEATTAAAKDFKVDADGNIVFTTPDGNEVKVNVKTDVIDPDVTYDDIVGKYYEPYVLALAKRGIISGTGNNMYSPELPCKRADFAILINNTLGLETTITKNFDDNTNPEKYYYNDVRMGYSAGILSGYGDNNYKPENYCTREEMFVLVAKTLEYLGVDVTSTSESVLNKYADKADISWWSSPYCAFLTDAGIITGSNGNIEPDRYINRAEMAVMMYKDYEYIVNYIDELKAKAAAAAVEEEEETTIEESTEATTAAPVATVTATATDDEEEE